MSGLSTTGSISLGCALVAGRNRVPNPAAGRTALRTRCGFSAIDVCTQQPPYVAPAMAVNPSFGLEVPKVGQASSLSGLALPRFKSDRLEACPTKISRRRVPAARDARAFWTFHSANRETLPSPYPPSAENKFHGSTAARRKY